MKSLLKSAAIIFLACLAPFLLLRVWLGNSDAMKLALTPFSAITLVNSKIEEKEKQGGRPDKLQTFHDFSLPFWKTFVLGMFSVFSVLAANSALSAILINLGDSLASPEEWMPFLKMLSVATIPLNLYVMFSVGHWIGIRSRTIPFATAALVGASCKLADLAVTLLAMSRTDFLFFLDVDKTDTTGLAKLLGGSVLLFTSMGILGCWRGKHRQQAFYLDHLLKSVAPESRATIIAITYEEAQRTVAAASHKKGTATA